MAYSYQTYSVGQVLTATELQQTEDNIKYHIHGDGTVTGSMQSISFTGSLHLNGFQIGYGGGRYCIIDYPLGTGGFNVSYGAAQHLPFPLTSSGTTIVDSEGIFQTNSNYVFKMPAGATQARFTFSCNFELSGPANYANVTFGVPGLFLTNSGAASQLNGSGGPGFSLSGTLSVSSGQQIPLTLTCNSGFTVAGMTAIVEVLC